MQRLRDLVAVQDEHSHVHTALRQRIGEIILEVENEELTETARRVVGSLGIRLATRRLEAGTGGLAGGRSAARVGHLNLCWFTTRGG